MGRVRLGVISTIVPGGSVLEDDARVQLRI